MSASEYRYIVRIAGKDVDGSKKLVVAISEIRGVGFNFAQVLLNTLKIDPNARVGFISEKDISEIEIGIRDPTKVGMPTWFLNRQKDFETGSTKQIITSDWDIMIKNDIEREKGVMSWRGFRHMMGLKVRGQRTRTTGRKGGAVGVKKTGKLLPTAAPGAPGAPAAGEAAATAAPGAAAPAGKGAASAPAAKGAAPTGKAPAAAPAKEAPKEAPKKPAEKGGK
ncbi:MAG: small subunit ribosomal protein S13 [Candidatus Nitrosomirales archaeon]